jgi:hypothetical protein
MLHRHHHVCHELFFRNPEMNFIEMTRAVQKIHVAPLTSLNDLTRMVHALHGGSFSDFWRSFLLAKFGIPISLNTKFEANENRATNANTFTILNCLKSWNVKKIGHYY